MAELDQQGWPNKADTGWCDYDLEVSGSRWSRLQLTTVTEQLTGANKLLRCRMRASWSLLARSSFWAACGLELLLAGLARDGFWLWMLALLGIPLLTFFAWFLKQEVSNLKNVIASLVNEAARQRGFTPVEYQPEDGRWVPIR